jgi:bifunctional DNA-binding transcriptional regulator/antitoxin component of YhaV-PrlF toxin-antitoxin module
MPTYVAKVDDEGRIELPSALRKRFEIVSGGEVEFFVSLDGLVFFHAISEASGRREFPHSAAVRQPPVSIREMDEGIAEHLAEDFERISRENRADKKSAAAE